MNKSLVAICAALVAAATFFSTGAEAGFGIRLGFGGPLPSFVAHGNGGGYSSHSYRKRYVARRCHKKAKTYAKRNVSEPKVAKVEKKSAPKVAKVEKKTTEKVAEKTASKSQEVAAAPIDDKELANSESSSITTLAVAAVEPTDETVPVKPVTIDAADAEAVPLPVIKAETKAAPKLEKAASKLDCKKFFPSVGMTLTVKCE